MAAPSTFDALSRVLAATSVGLGLTEIVVPGAVLRMTGIPATRRARRVVRVLGLRECAHGAAIAADRRLVWTRVVGDVLDVALLVAGATSPRARRGRAVAVGAVLTVIGAADVAASVQPRPRHELA